MWSPVCLAPFSFTNRGSLSLCVYRFVENLLCFCEAACRSFAPRLRVRGSGADAPVQHTSQMSPEELRALLQPQQDPIGHPQARLESLAVADRNSVPDLTAEAVEQMLGGDKVASWMRQSSEALRDYVRSASAAPARLFDVMGNAMECPRGDRLAYRIWGIILDSQQAYAQMFAPESSSRANPSNPLDAMSWPDAVKNGGPSFKYKGIDFAMRQGVLHWMTKKGRWVPISARPFGDCQRCAKAGVPSEQLRHWHFQCPHWS